MNVIPESDGRMFRRILCPIDFSDGSRHALDHAHAIGHAYGSAITAFHVLAFMPYGDPMISPALAFTAEDVENARSSLMAFVSAEAGRIVDCQVTEGNIVNAIVNEAEGIKADAIVMGTHGRTGFQRLMLGSVTERVLRRAPCPVLTVPPRMPDAVAIGPSPFQRILCCTDYSTSSGRAIQFGVSLARQTGARLTLMNAVEAMSVYEPVVLETSMPLTEDLRRESAARLHTIASGTGLPGVSEVVVTGRSHRSILQQADDEQTDLIIIGVHSGLAERFFLGSTTNHVVRSAKCAVLSVR